MKKVFLVILTMVYANSASAGLFCKQNEISEEYQQILVLSKKTCFEIGKRLGSMESTLAQIKSSAQAEQKRDAIKAATEWLNSEEVKKYKNHCGIQ